jgi:alpha-beta hydrolase superfamily lysophospholipase
LKIAALLAAIAGSSALAASPPLPTGPLVGDMDLSPFYRWREALPAKPGVMLRQELAPAQADITSASLMQRILYTSTDLRWKAGIVPVSGTLYLPKGTPPAGGWPLVTWAHGTLGVADICAPSWAGHKPRDATYIQRWLENGFAVVATDYQGLGGPGPHPYLIWEAEGRSVLDSARAALAAYPDKLAKKVFVTGQSQGSGAAIGATRIAPSYAPDLALQATVATGVVSTFPQGPYKAPSTAIGSPNYITLLMLGGALPDNVPPDSLMREKGEVLLMMARGRCSPDVRAVAEQEKITAANAFREPVDKIEAKLAPVTDMTPVKLPVPVLLGTGQADKTLVPRRQFAAVKALCAAGSDIVWKSYPGATHNGGLLASFPDALALFKTVLAGQKVESNCASVGEPGEPTAAGQGLLFND